MIFGTDSDPDSAEDNPVNSSSATGTGTHHHHHHLPVSVTHNQVANMMAATTTVQLPPQQHSPQPQILWH